MLSTLSKLTSVEELTVEWGFLPCGYDCSAILSSIYPLLARNLKVLKLSMLFSVMLDVLTAMGGLDNLRELSLEFTYVSGGTNGMMLPSDDNEALNLLALRVNSLSPTLRLLAITSTGHLDFSPFFGSLEGFRSFQSFLCCCCLIFLTYWMRQLSIGSYVGTRLSSDWCFPPPAMLPLFRDLTHSIKRMARRLL
ncbi:hypothetical protein BDQ17DRAFT_983942 [Cyathus striatus]|nr:hypothetical protein BDQ17DRAFT_983942 [Cyathus striatus]